MRPLVVLLLVASAPWAGAQRNVEPAEGVFLVSEPRIDGGPFHRSVVLLLSHGEDGTLGLIVNRPTDITLSEALPDLDAGEASPQLYFGGPVGLDGLLALFRSDAPPEGAETVMDGVYYSGEREVLEELLAEGKRSDELRLFVGHSGWAAGQLEAELLQGAWDVVAADAFTLFRTEPEQMWEYLRGGGPMIAGGTSAQPETPVEESAGGAAGR